MNYYQNNQYGYPFNSAYGYGGPCIPPNAMMWTQAPMSSGGVPYPQNYGQQMGWPIQTPINPPLESNFSAREQSESEKREMERRVQKDGNEERPQRQLEADIIPASPYPEKMDYKAWENMQNLYLYEAKMIAQNQNHLRRIETETKLKERLAEEKAERKRSQHLKIEILQNGEVISQTVNLLTGGKPRIETNFKKPRIYALKSTSGERGYFRLEFEVAEKHCTVYLQEVRCGEPKYLLKKIQAAGGIFQKNKRNDRCESVLGLWAALLEVEVPVVEIPEIYGWNQSSNGEFRFVEEGEILWDDVKKLAR